MHESRANSHSRGKRKHVPTKPKIAPVVVNWVHPAAIAEARHLAFGRDVHIVYDTNEGCMWIRNGAK